ncbi:MAG: hypothetical protein ACI379_16875 [Nocardioides sp.]|uniref:hypothetical protein n=1 Tax=Nocardioides sp. TaxID=35761 RepID=UPI003F127C3A
MGKKDKKRGTVAKLPKRECCVAKTRCNRCPLRMLKEGTLPPGYTVKRRTLVRVEHAELLTGKDNVAKLKVSKAELKKAAAKAAKKSKATKSTKVKKKAA